MIPTMRMGKSTRKSIETNSTGELGNDLIPILPEFLFKGFTEIQTSHRVIKSTMSEYKSGHQKLAKTRL